MCLPLMLQAAIVLPLCYAQCTLAFIMVYIAHWSASPMGPVFCCRRLQHQRQTHFPPPPPKKKKKKKKPSFVPAAVLVKPPPLHPGSGMLSRWEEGGRGKKGGGRKDEGREREGGREGGKRERGRAFDIFHLCLFSSLSFLPPSLSLSVLSG